MQISELKNILKEFGANVRYEHDLKKKNWFNIGGKTKVFFKANNNNEIIKFLKIIKNSKVKLFLVNDKFQLAKFIKKNMSGKKIVIGMGAGTISNWMRELPKLI